MIEEMLYQHLLGCEELKPHLGQYAQRIAVFNQQAPDDKDRNWNGPQYGRIVYAVNMQGDPERKVSGTLYVDIICQDGRQNPDELEPIVRLLIDGYFFSRLELTIAAQWRQSDPFADPTKKQLGVTVQFDLLAFPNQDTMDPDPVALVNQWTRERFPNAYVVGTSSLPSVWTPTVEHPAIYWRMAAINKCSWIPDTFACSWQTATLQAHIMAPDRELRASIARQIDNILTLNRRLIFSDGSPLMTDLNNQINPGADPMRQGQVTIEGTFGVSKQIPQVPPMNHIYRKEVYYGG